MDIIAAIVDEITIMENEGSWDPRGVFYLYERLEQLDPTHPLLCR